MTGEGRPVGGTGISFSRFKDVSKKEERPLGILEIAAELGCSARTVRRMHAEGKIATYKLGGATSPIKMRRVDLIRLQKKRGK